MLRNGIIAVVLLENLKMAAGVDGSQDHGIRLEVSGDVGDLKVVNTCAQVEGQLLAHDGKLLVVNREGGRVALLLLLCIRCKGRIELIERSPEKNCR